MEELIKVDDKVMRPQYGGASQMNYTIVRRPTVHRKCDSEAIYRADMKYQAYSQTQNLAEISD